MIQLREIDHIVLRVVDLEAMLHFYVSVLGCPVERRQDEIGLVQLRAGRSLVDLVPVDGPLGRAGGAPAGIEGRNLDHFCFRVDPFDADAIRRHLSAAGIAAGPVESRYGAEGLGPSIYITDPEGNTVELRGPPAAVTRPRNIYAKYHAHVYFGPDTVAQARQLCHGAGERFNIRVGRVHEKLVGPHPHWSCQLAFDSSQFEAVIAWLEQHRNGLDVLVHGLTGDDLADHTLHASWLGQPSKLNLAMFGGT